MPARRGALRLAIRTDPASAVRPACGDPAPDAGAQHPEDGEAEAGRREHDPHEIDLGTLSGRFVLEAPRQRQDAEHDQHLAGEHEPPAEIGGEHPADERADRDGEIAVANEPAP
jgi:hypothetical protein